MNGNSCVVGASNGELQVWAGTSQSTTKKIHTQGVDAISMKNKM